MVASVQKAAGRLSPDMLPTFIVTFCGGIAALTANARYPYPQAPAHRWAIFLPLAVNVMLCDPAPQHTVPGTLTQPSKNLR